MKKVLLLSMSCLLAINALGQSENGQSRPSNIDWKEDSTEVVTIDDIVKREQEITRNSFQESHNKDVWSRKGYLNLSYSSTTLSPDGDYMTGLDDEMVPDYKSNWGVSIKIGRSYRLHKKPIANILQFYIDYSYIDLGVNHFEKNGGPQLYDSRKKTGDDKFITPWNLEKYEFNYGMSVGPSLSVAPFMFTNSKAAHFLKFNMWYHVGYHVSMLNLVSNKEADANPATQTTGDDGKMRDDTKLEFGHGFASSFGLSLTWKFVGIGYEYRSANAKYKSLNKELYGSEKYKFKTSSNRVFVQFRF